MKSILPKVLLVMKAAEAFLLPFGPWGLAGIAFLDSAFLPLPHAIDVLVIDFCVRNPARMLWYGLLATLGSVVGCLVLYFIARTAGHAAAERKIGKERMDRIRAWFERHEFLTVMVPAVMPPPTPFKAFIITAGVTEVHLGKFIVALTLGRAIRYMGEAWLAVHYGPRVWQFATAHGLLGLGLFTAGTLLALGIMLLRARARRTTPVEEHISALAQSAATDN